MEIVLGVTLSYYSRSDPLLDLPKSSYERRLGQVQSFMNLQICFRHRIKIANTKIVKICSKTNI